jgi:hypothetical protein
MDTSKLKKFSQFARRSLIEQVQSKFKLVLSPDSAARREYPQTIKALEEKQKQLGDDEQLIEQVAYTWFNRFCALRFMDVNQYNRIMVLSPISGQFQPELLAEAKAGHLDDVVFNGKTREKIQGLLSGSVPSRDGQAEAYRMMIVAVCNDYHRLMPYLFQRIEDYTELLMPDDLLSGNSILAYTREAMTPENCESVESIGWLYQFYISEKKDLVFEGLKKNKKITPENIPAATQLFTPHWIVKYLVENSLGRLWMLNNPNSKVIEQMEYYIKPVEDEADFLRISTPEEIKVCDPAVGSGHMLTYAYDLLYAIYLDANYDAADIPELILTKNLYGIEIDERAAELAAFALSMKAIKGNPADESNNRRRFFRNPIKPNICRLDKVKIDEAALEEYIVFAGRDLFTQDLLETLTEFEEADNFGSLIQPTLKNPAEILELFEAKNAQVDLFLKDTHESILKILKQAKYLSSIYHVVTANPPYMGKKNMNSRLQSWVVENYKDVAADFYACFIERCGRLSLKTGYSCMITMDSWFAGDEFTSFRKYFLEEKNLKNCIHLGSHAFEEIKGEVVRVAAYCFSSEPNIYSNSVFYDLTEFNTPETKEAAFKLRANEFIVNQTKFIELPRCVMAYFSPQEVIDLFVSGLPLKEIAEAFTGLQTGDNELYLRRWYELSFNDICFSASNKNKGTHFNQKWFPYVKGSDFRKWYGNNDLVINWSKNGESIKSNKSSTVRNEKFYFREGLAYNTIADKLSVRYVEQGYIFDQKNSMFFTDNRKGLEYSLALLNSSSINPFLRTIAPKDFGPGSMKLIPIPKNNKNMLLDNKLINLAIEISVNDWNLLERSWGFSSNCLVPKSSGEFKFSAILNKVKVEAKSNTETMYDIEFELNNLFRKAYALKEECNQELAISDVTLFQNSNYKLGLKNDRDYLLEFISFSVGCMFGRYSLNKPGLMIANQNETIDSYLKICPSPSFMPDEDNVIPIIDIDGDWFEDDISERFKEFIKVTFGGEHFTENFAFIERVIGKDIKKYFVKDFYADHVQRYKKRPIYWMFSSPNGSFNALIYMHRYLPDTASIVLNDYLREFRTKLEARKQSYEQVEISASASQKDKTQAIKAITKINNVLEEINDYEHDVLYPLAGKKIEIDLDDGVKHNYSLFGNALKKVTGLS